jgi:hypothetical protein
MINYNIYIIKEILNNEDNKKNLKLKNIIIIKDFIINIISKVLLRKIKI